MDPFQDSLPSLEFVLHEHIWFLFMLEFKLKFFNILLCSSFLIQKIGVGLCLYFVELYFLGLNLHLLCYLKSGIGLLLIFFDGVFVFGQLLFHLLHFDVHGNYLFFFEDQLLENFFVFLLELFHWNESVFAIFGKLGVQRQIETGSDNLFVFALCVRGL